MSEHINFIGDLEYEHPARTVFKYPLDAFKTTVSLPNDSVILHVGEQDGTVMMWVDVPLIASDGVSDRTFSVYPTGMARDTSLCHAYIGTVVKANGFVAHVFQTHQHTPEEILFLRLAEIHEEHWDDE